MIICIQTFLTICKIDFFFGGGGGGEGGVQLSVEEDNSHSGLSDRFLVGWEMDISERSLAEN